MLEAYLALHQVVLDGVTMRDWSWFADSRGYFPLVRGLEVELRHVIVNSFKMPGGGGPAGNDPVLETQFEINPGHTNLLRAVVDTTGGTLTQQPFNLAETGGWSLSSDRIGCNLNHSGFFGTSQDPPLIAAGAQQTVLQSVGVAALRLVASAPVNGGLACAVEVSSPRIAVDAGRSYVLRAWMRAARGTFQRLNVSTDFFKRAPVDTTASLSRSAAPSTTLMSLPISSWLIGATGLFQ